MTTKQVDKSHYDFGKYVHKRRWASIWHQLDELIKLNPKRVLEIGPGPGLLKVTAKAVGVDVETLDIDPDLEPDHLASADAMPFDDNVFDVVCAFQVVEHVPFERSLVIFSEMARVARKSIIISVPDARPAWSYSFYVPKRGQFKFLFLRPWLGPKEHVFDGQHYWEVNKRGYEYTAVCAALEGSADVELVRTYRVQENPYHRFFIFQKRLP